MKVQRSDIPSKHWEAHVSLLEEMEGIERLIYTKEGVFVEYTKDGKSTIVMYKNSGTRITYTETLRETTAVRVE